MGSFRLQVDQSANSRQFWTVCPSISGRTESLDEMHNAEWVSLSVTASQQSRLCPFAVTGRTSLIDSPFQIVPPCYGRLSPPTCNPASPLTPLARYQSFCRWSAFISDVPLALGPPRRSSFTFDPPPPNTVWTSSFVVDCVRGCLAVTPARTNIPSESGSAIIQKKMKQSERKRSNPKENQSFKTNHSNQEESQ